MAPQRRVRYVHRHAGEGHGTSRGYGDRWTGGGCRPRRICRLCGHQARAGKGQKNHRRETASGGHVCRDVAACTARQDAANDPAGAGLVPCPVCRAAGRLGAFGCSTCRGAGRVSKQVAVYLENGFGGNDHA